jgi:hypothetical protein
MDEEKTDGTIRDVEIVPAVPSAVTAQEAVERYQAVQKVFDKMMPDCIMAIRTKKFRKKAYWRAIAAEFRVGTELIREERLEVDGDWGYLVTYRALTPDGLHSDGDGACMASEKSGAMSTLHNVRAHAHTRAKNRAISDLVGFGEVSADELPPGAFDGNQPREPRAESKPQTTTKGGTLANPNQIKMLSAKGYARAEVLTGESGNHAMCGSIVKAAMRLLGFEDKKQITAVSIDAMVKAIDAAILDPEDEAHAMIPDEKF